MYRIAVVTVSYNSDKMLKKTMESVLAQTYSELEYWVQDGGSTDNTLFLLEDYKKKFAWAGIKYGFISGKDNGIYNAMNKSLDYIEADYVMFLNCGDYLANNHIITDIFTEKELNDIDIIYGNYYRYIDEYERLIRPSNIEMIKKYMIVTHQAIFTRTSLLRERNYDESYKIAADHDFYLEMYLKNKRFLYMDISIVYFEVNGISQKNAMITHLDRNRLLFSHGCISRVKYIVRTIMTPYICLKKWIVRMMPLKIRCIRYRKCTYEI